jgi:tetratricopeptide (TPR) repeat protein
VFTRPARGVVACARVRVAVAVVAALLCAGAAITQAHGSHSEREHDATELIARTPSDPVNYLERAEVYREVGRLDDAEADLARAATLAPGHPAVVLLGARLDLDRGAAAAADHALDALLARHPRNGEARALRADALAAEGLTREAARQLDLALADLPRPTPEHYLQLAAWQAGGRPPDLSRAAKTLERAIDQLGPAPALIERRVALAVTLGRADDAVAWHDRLQPFMGSEPAWLARRGELLDASRRSMEALAAYTSALEAIEALPSRRRAALAGTGLEAEIRARLKHTSPGRMESP